MAPDQTDDLTNDAAALPRVVETYLATDGKITALTICP
jgi:hypothetical protein